MKILNAIFRYAMVLGSLVLSSHCFSQINESSFDKIESLQKEDERNLVIFIKTDWCGYCAMMENSVFTDDKIQQKLNDDFYFISLNGEFKEDIIFANQTFTYKPTGYKTGTHELAMALGTINGKLSYPALIILNPKNEIIFQYSGFIDKVTLLKILSI